LCKHTVQSAETGGRVGSRHVALSTDRDFQYSDQLPQENSQVFFIRVEKGWRMTEQQVVLLINEDFGPCTVWHSKYTTH